MASELPAQRGGAKALLLTVLGEFVLPGGGSAWTSSLIDAGAALGIGEKNARQAISRIADQGLLESQRHGRKVQWSLTAAGTNLLKSGTDRIYTFATTTVDWTGEWLVAHCPIAEPQRSVRNQFRTRLGFLGFGELSASLVISPHIDREPELRATLEELGLLETSVVMRSTLGSDAESHDIVARAWDLDELSRAYESFSADFVGREPADACEAFRSVVEIVHDWRRFPSVDPELPSQLLPSQWAAREAAAVFHRQRGNWSPAAQAWFHTE